MDPQVLIVGAGPTGLVLALWLARQGVPLRIVDKNAGPGQACRAMAVQVGQPLRDTVQRRGLALHEFAWSDRAHAAGLERDALYLVRPDGYVALAEAGHDAEQLQRFLAKFKVLPRERETA